MNFTIFTKKMAVIAVIFFMFLIGIVIFFVSMQKFINKRHNYNRTFFQGIFGEKSVLVFVLVELLTAFALISGAFGLYFSLDWALAISLLSLVTLIYTSLRNFGWRIDGEDFLKSEILNITGFTGGSVSIIILILNFQ